MGSQEREGIGAHAMWGFSPAQDLLKDAPPRGEGFDTTCIPVAQLYVWESQIEVIARHLLLLQVAQDWELPIRQRANVFLEIFANTLVQERTSRYIDRLGKGLVEALFSTGAMADVVDLSLLKCRQRDLLEETFKSWSFDVPCHLTRLRENRLRTFFRERYDHRKSVVDWDFTNRLKEVASIIHHSQYRDWRLKGTAYEFGDQVYDKPNRTMMSYAEGMVLKGQHRGLKKELRGFWLDIRVGPFITFGVDCDRPNKHAEELFAVLNKGTGTEQHRHNTAEVAVYSVISYLWGLEARECYTMTKKHDVYSGLGEDICAVERTKGDGEGQDKATPKEQNTNAHSLERGDKTPEGVLSAPADDSRHSAKCDDNNSQAHVSEDMDDIENRAEANRREQALQRAQCIVETFDGVKVFMMTGDLSQCFSKPRYRHLFDRVHLGLTAVDLAGAAVINEALADEAVITMDTGRYMVPFNKEQQRSFVERACGMAHERGWEPYIGSYRSRGVSTAPANDAALSKDYVGFSFNRKPAYA